MSRILQLLQQKCLPSVALVQQLCRQVTATLIEEPNVLRIDPGVKVIGDIYGQYYDLVEMIDEQSPNNYLFMGNYIGHGNYSLQTILLLFCLKVLNPQRVSLLRGNQETYQMSMQNGLFEQAYTKYGNTQAWRLIVEVFKYLPLCAVIGDTYLAVHGDLSHYESLDEVREIPRYNQSVDKSGILWNSVDYEDRGNADLAMDSVSSLESIRKFLTRNKLRTMVKGNGVYARGFQKDSNQTCISLCSCPYFMKKYDNLGCIMVINEQLGYDLVTFRRTIESDKGFSYSER